MLEAVIEGSVESLTTINDVVVGTMPNVRKECAIYRSSDHVFGNSVFLGNPERRISKTVPWQ